MKIISLVFLILSGTYFVSKTQEIDINACNLSLDICNIQKNSFLKELNSDENRNKELGFEDDLTDVISGDAVKSNCKTKLKTCIDGCGWLIRDRERYKLLYNEERVKKNIIIDNDTIIPTVITPSINTPSINQCEQNLQNCRNEADKLRSERDYWKNKYNSLINNTGNNKNNAGNNTNNTGNDINNTGNDINNIGNDIDNIGKIEIKENLLEKIKKNTRGAVAKQNYQFKGKKYDIYIIDPTKNTIRLYLKDPNGNNLSFNDIRRFSNDRLTFAMNAGMYHPDGNTVGLYIENGREITPLNTMKLDGNFYMQPNGVFALTNDNKAFISSTDDYPAKASHLNVLWATQSGPMLLNKGEINNNFKENSTNVNIRNGVGVTADNKIIFVISNDRVNFYEFAYLFKTEFGCQFALYLDGFVSQMYLPEIRRTHQGGENLGPIITVINTLKE